MARCLVTYISDPRKVQSYVRAQFGSAPALSSIKELRRSFERPLAHQEPYKAFEGYYPDVARQEAEAASKRFLERIRLEQSISEARRNVEWMDTAPEDLRSPYLTTPSMVDAAWERQLR